MKKDLTPYAISEAIKKVKLESKEKFDATVEAHITLDLDATKSEQSVRYTTVLPKGTGKTLKVAVLASKLIPSADLQINEEDLDKIMKGSIKPKIDFDVFITEPKFMSKVAKVAKILGPLGLMPNPKTGTVTENIEKAVEQVKKGKVEIRTEKDSAVIHTIFGKISFSEEALTENLSEVINSLRQNRPPKAAPEWIKSLAICSTMGASVRVDLATI